MTAESIPAAPIPWDVRKLVEFLAEDQFFDPATRKIAERVAARAILADRASRDPAPAGVAAWIFEWKPKGIDNEWQTEVSLSDPRNKPMREYRNVRAISATPTDEEAIRRAVEEDEVKAAAFEYLSHKGERPERILRGGYALWETCVPAMRVALIVAARLRAENAAAGGQP